MGKRGRGTWEWEEQPKLLLPGSLRRRGKGLLGDGKWRYSGSVAELGLKLRGGKLFKVK